MFGDLFNIQETVMGLRATLDDGDWILIHLLPVPAGRPKWPRFYLAVKLVDGTSTFHSGVHMIAVPEDRDPLKAAADRAGAPAPKGDS